MNRYLTREEVIKESSRKAVIQAEQAPREVFYHCIGNSVYPYAGVAKTYDKKGFPMYVYAVYEQDYTADAAALDEIAGYFIES